MTDIPSFRSFLVEAKQSFPYLRAAVHMQWPSRGPGFADELIARFRAVAKKEIPNAEFIDLKGYLSRIVELMFDMHKSNEPAVEDMIKRRREHQNWALTYEIEAPHQMNHVAGKLKKAKAALPGATHRELDRIYLTWLISRAEEVLPLIDLLMSAIPVKRGAVKPVDAHQKFVAPLVSHAEGRVVYDILHELTERVKQDYADACEESYLNDIQTYLKRDPDPPRGLVPRQWPILSYTELWIIGRSSGTGSRITYTPVRNYKAVVKELAAKDAVAMQQQFLVKNAAKLGNLVISKNVALLHKPKILHATSSRHAIEGDILIAFKDGSSFRVTNKIVLKRNTFGRLFAQFPTTFHDVLLPKGRAMGRPSEERMHSVFLPGRE